MTKQTRPPTTVHQGPKSKYSSTRLFEKLLLVHHIIKFVIAFERAKYSASVGIHAVSVCSFDFQITGHSGTQIMYPVILLTHVES